MKYILDDNLYEETKNIVLGKTEKSPLLIEFSDWFLSTYSVRILNIHLEQSKRLLSIIIENADGYRKMFHEPYHVPHKIEEYVPQIVGEFNKLVSKCQSASESQFAGMFVNYYDFSQETKTDVNKKAIREANTKLKEKYSMIWEVARYGDSGPVIFYYFDREIKENEVNGISETIAIDYLSILRKYDELNFVTRENLDIKFDSKEKVDLNCQGNLFLYFR